MKRELRPGYFTLMSIRAETLEIKQANTELGGQRQTRPLCKCPGV